VCVLAAVATAFKVSGSAIADVVGAHLITDNVSSEIANRPQPHHATSEISISRFLLVFERILVFHDAPDKQRQSSVVKTVQFVGGKRARLKFDSRHAGANRLIRYV